jgi:hypothetical protein
MMFRHHGVMYMHSLPLDFHSQGLRFMKDHLHTSKGIGMITIIR